MSPGGQPQHGGGIAHFAKDLLTSSAVRRSFSLKVRHPANLFQPFNDTWPHRYPEVFGFLRDKLEDRPETSLLSFGCSTGDELFSLRDYFAHASMTGFDVSRANIRDCRHRQRGFSHEPISFVHCSSTRDVPDEAYHAILCMATLRHGELGPNAPSSEHLIRFQDFERNVNDFARCLRPGGFLAIEFSNFRFRDASCAGQFDCVLDLPGPQPSKVPLYGRDNRLLSEQLYREVVFRKRDSASHKDMA